MEKPTEARYRCKGARSGFCGLLCRWREILLTRAATELLFKKVCIEDMCLLPAKKFDIKRLVEWFAPKSFVIQARLHHERLKQRVARHGKGATITHAHALAIISAGAAAAECCRMHV
jgi:hypothetical protein